MQPPKTAIPTSTPSGGRRANGSIRQPAGKLASLLLSGLAACAVASDDGDDPGRRGCDGGKCDGIDDGGPGGVCETNADCPSGAKFCLPDPSDTLTCQAGVDTGYAACGEIGNALGVGAACDDETCGGSGGADRCVTAGPLEASFCSMACSTDSQCGEHAFCGRLEGGFEHVCIPYRCACAAETPQSELLDQTLAAVDRDSCDLGQRFGSLETIYADSIANDPLRPTFFQALFYAPMAIPPAKRRLRDEALAARDAGTPISGPIRLGARLWDETLPQSTDPAAAARTFEDEVMELLGEDGEDRRAEIEADAEDLPVELKTALAPIVAAVGRAIELRHSAIPADTDLDRWWRAPMGMWMQMREVVPNADKIDLTRPADATFLLEELQYDRLALAAVVLAEAVEQSELAELSVPGQYDFNIETPAGRIVIGGTADDHYADADPALQGDLLLFVDTGGDDVYEVPVGATASPQNPVSLAIDLGGADHYTYAKFPDPGNANRRPDADAAVRRPTVPRHSLSEVRRQGGGTLGVGMLLDLGTQADRYEALRFSQGSGVLGVGVLYDQGGDDVYHAETVAQGAGQFGLGVLVDETGDDQYIGFSVTQGAVHVKAVGLLLDYEGNDDYWTSPGNIYVGQAARISGHDYFYEYGINQGASWGRRGDFPQDGLKNEGHASGGIGVLLDLGGDDAYTCGAFCQGLGYWFGTGILYDEDGSDSYYGRIFAGGAGVHFGLGILHDGGDGDDEHYPSDALGLILGAGDDLSLAWFEDQGGNDRYNSVRNKSVGSGSEKGTGIFLEMSGDDVYTSNSAACFGFIEDPPSMRSPASPRFDLRTQGVFADGGGLDSYERRAFFTPEPIGNDRSWLHPWLVAGGDNDGHLDDPVTYDAPTVYAVGLDR